MFSAVLRKIKSFILWAWGMLKTIIRSGTTQVKESGRDNIWSDIGKLTKKQRNKNNREAKKIAREQLNRDEEPIEHRDDKTFEERAIKIYGKSGDKCRVIHIEATKVLMKENNKFINVTLENMTNKGANHGNAFEILMQDKRRVIFTANHVAREMPWLDWHEVNPMISCDVMLDKGLMISKSQINDAIVCATIRGAIKMCNVQILHTLYTFNNGKKLIPAGVLLICEFDDEIVYSGAIVGTQSSLFVVISGVVDHERNIIVLLAASLMTHEQNIKLQAVSDSKSLQAKAYNTSHIINVINLSSAPYDFVIQLINNDEKFKPKKDKDIREYRQMSLLPKLPLRKGQRLPSVVNAQHPTIIAIDEDDEFAYIKIKTLTAEKEKNIKTNIASVLTIRDPKEDVGISSDRAIEVIDHHCPRDIADAMHLQYIESVSALAPNSLIRYHRPQARWASGTAGIKSFAANIKAQVVTINFACAERNTYITLGNKVKKMVTKDISDLDVSDHKPYKDLFYNMRAGSTDYMATIMGPKLVEEIIEEEEIIENTMVITAIWINFWNWCVNGIKKVFWKIKSMWQRISTVRRQPKKSLRSNIQDMPMTIIYLASQIINLWRDFAIIRPSGNVLKVLGNHLHKKWGGTKTGLEDLETKTGLSVKGIFRSYLRLEKVNSDQVLDDLDDEYYKLRTITIERTSLISVLLSATLKWVMGYPTTATIVSAIALASYALGYARAVHPMLTGILTTSTLKRIIGFGFTGVRMWFEGTVNQATKLIEPVVTITASLMSPEAMPYHRSIYSRTCEDLELDGIVAIEKEESMELFNAVKEIIREGQLEKLIYLAGQLVSTVVMKGILNWIIHSDVSAMISVGSLVIAIIKSDGVALRNVLHKQNTSKIMSWLIKGCQMIPACFYKVSDVLERAAMWLVIWFEKQKDIERYGYTWEQAERHLMRNEVSAYWAKAGLRIDDIHTISIQADDPNKEREPLTTGLRLYERFIVPETAVRYAKNYDFARQDDQMHTKAIHKRLAGKKTNPKLAFLEQQLVKMMFNFNLKPKEESRRKRILQALATSGTAGQWAKHTILETDWKTVENPISIKLWSHLQPIITCIIAANKARQGDLFTYMLYRKVETLPLDENGNVKTTRLIQAAGLEMRIPDAVIFGDLNDAIAESRDRTYADIGSRLDHELVVFLDPYEDTWKITGDFSDYDGSQHPMHMMSCKYLRMSNELTYRQDLNELIVRLYYLRNKYRLHVERIVKSSWGITIQMMGQLASGDIVTSDDNTLRSSAFLYMIDSDYERDSDQQRTKTAAATGDDIAKKGTYTQNPLEYAGIAAHKAKNLGYNLKECLFYHSNKRGDSAVRLGHKVETLVLHTQIGPITVPCLARPEIRLYGKLLLSAEVADAGTRKVKEAILAKMMSYIHVLWGMPEIVLICMTIVVQLTGVDLVPSEAQNPYNWNNIFIDRTTISEYGPIQSATGIGNLCVTAIENPNRLDMQEEAARCFIKVVEKYTGVKRSIQEVIEKGVFKRQDTYEIFKTIYKNKQVQIRTRDYEYCRSNADIQSCRHVNREAIEWDQINVNIYVMCEPCAKSGSINSTRRPRYVIGRCVYKQEINISDEERGLLGGKIPVHLSEIRWENQGHREQKKIPGQYEQNEI